MDGSAEQGQKTDQLQLEVGPIGPGSQVYSKISTCIHSIYSCQFKKLFSHVRLVLILAVSVFLSGCLVEYSTPTNSEDIKNIPVRKIGTLGPIHSLTYDRGIECSGCYPDDDVSVRFDLDSGALELKKDGESKASCDLDDGRRQQIDLLLEDAELCEPAPLPAGTATCMAYSMSDLKLEGEDKPVFLRAPICNSGLFLCNGEDTDLRTLIKDIIANPPPECAQ